MIMYTIYFLQSKDRKHFYIGSTSDLESRLTKHNNSSSRSTKPYRPWIVICSEKYPTKQEAAKREFHLKTPKGYIEKKNIMEKYKK